MLEASGPSPAFITIETRGTSPPAKSLQGIAVSPLELQTPHTHSDFQCSLRTHIPPHTAHTHVY